MSKLPSSLTWSSFFFCSAIDAVFIQAVVRFQAKRGQQTAVLLCYRRHLLGPNMGVTYFTSSSESLYVVRKWLKNHEHEEWEQMAFKAALEDSVDELSTLKVQVKNAIVNHIESQDLDMQSINWNFASVGNECFCFVTMFNHLPHLPHSSKTAFCHRYMHFVIDLYRKDGLHSSVSAFLPVRCYAGDPPVLVNRSHVTCLMKW